MSGYDDSAAPPSPILALNAAVDGCPPLFCVHAGFGTVFDYEPLARRLNGRRSVLAIQARSLLDPNWRDASLQRMAEDYVALIRQRQAEGPYHLLGWSLGGTLGMLMAAELERQGQQVAFLGLLDSYVPEPRRPPPMTGARICWTSSASAPAWKPVRHWPPVGAARQRQRRHRRVPWRRPDREGRAGLRRTGPGIPGRPAAQATLRATG
nr:alpha/beta fold hydrolase [Pseudomonas aeruginosa]